MGGLGPSPQRFYKDGRFVFPFLLGPTTDPLCGPGQVDIILLILKMETLSTQLNFLSLLPLGLPPFLDSQFLNFLLVFYRQSLPLSPKLAASSSLLVVARYPLVQS